MGEIKGASAAMVETPENRVRRPVINWAAKNGVLHIRLHFGRGAAVGWPDDVFVYGGKVVFFEFKAPGKTPKNIQHFRMNELVEHGAIATWSDNKEDAIAFLKKEFGL